MAAGLAGGIGVSWRRGDPVTRRAGRDEPGPSGNPDHRGSRLLEGVRVEHPAWEVDAARFDLCGARRGARSDCRSCLSVSVGLGLPARAGRHGKAGVPTCRPLPANEGAGHGVGGTGPGATEVS